MSSKNVLGMSVKKRPRVSELGLDDEEVALLAFDALTELDANTFYCIIDDVADEFDREELVQFLQRNNQENQGE